MSGQLTQTAKGRSEPARQAFARTAGPRPTPGNQLLQAWLRRDPASPNGRLGGGLSLALPRDTFEKEAEAAADAFSAGRLASPLTRLTGGRSPLVRCRTCEAAAADHPNGQCRTCAARLAAKPATVGAAPEPAARDQDVVARAIAHGGEGGPLDRPVRATMERHFGADFSRVSVHQGPLATAANRAISARAFTVGGDIWLGPGASRDDPRLIAHELAHVVQQGGRGGQPGLIQRVGPADEAIKTPAERQIEAAARAEEAERQRQHEAWEAGTLAHAVPGLAGQATSVGGQRERIGLALTAQRAAALDAVAGGTGWLNAQLQAQGYDGPGVAEVRAAWAEAMVAADLLKQDLTTGNVSSESRLEALASLPDFYTKADRFAAAAEQAHRLHDDAENARLQADYERRLAAYNERVRLDQASWGPIGEPGEPGARAGQALARGAPPDPPIRLTPPPAISGEVAAAANRVLAADSVAEWSAVSEDLKRIGNGITTLVTASLPGNDPNRVGLEYLESLSTRLEQFEGQHAVSVRIPALFYPADRTLTQQGPGGQVLTVPQSIPWEFYLINTGVTSHDRPATSGGEWVLIDLTSGQRFENRAPASDLASALLQQGAAVDPPLSMFSALNSRLRFPVGRLYFKLPSGTDYVLPTTEPWSLSDWLSAIGIALTAIALVAGVIATGGAAAPAAIAFYAGVGAGAFSIGAKLAELHERNEQGVLTGADVNQAAISIGIDLISMATLGFARLAGNAAKAGVTGERLIIIQRAAQISKGVSLTSNIYQAMTATAGFIAAFEALQNQPGLSEEERNRRRGELVRRALLTGVLLTVAIRGDVKDLAAGHTVRINRVDPDNVLVPEEAAPHGETQSPHPEVPATATPHPEVAPDVHAHAAEAGSGVRVGPQTHAVGVGGRGRTLDCYFCSDLCTVLRDKLRAIIGALPHSHPEREIFEGLLSRANGASARLTSGRITQQQADEIVQRLADDIARHSAAEPLFAALMNTAVEDLVAHRAAIRARLALEAGASHTALTSQAERQAANRGPNRAGEPTAEPAERSPLETDLLGGVDIQGVDRPSRRLQQLKFDTGNFSHTYAEALVDGLPRGLQPEVVVTLRNGSTGRADRVRFIYDSDGDRIGAYVYEIKPNTTDRVASESQRQGYVDGLQAEIEASLRAKGKPIPTQAPDGGPLYGGQVMTYDRERMLAVLRALRANRRDYGLRVSNVDVAAGQAADEAIARQVFGQAGP